MPSEAERRARVKAILDSDLVEMRCRSCGIYLGYRRRTGMFMFWCSEACALTLMAKFDKDQYRDELAVELYLGGMGMMEISRLTQTGRTRIQQLLYRRGISLVREREQEQDTA